MQMEQAAVSAVTILRTLGEQLEHVRFLTKGATCSVWEVQSDRRAYALRLIDCDDRVLDGAVDAFLRRSILREGGCVAEPVLNSEIANGVWERARWTLDVFVHGTHPARAQLSDETCRALGETLAVLHSIPVQGFGRPKCHQSNGLVGEKAVPIEGVAQRFENPLPEVWEKGIDHPALLAAPDIASEILSRLGDVAEIIAQGSGVLCHSDLHEGQMICDEGNLAALIDFGDATILDRHWDLASVYYFHGVDVLMRVLNSYNGIQVHEAVQPETVRLFSIAVALHHASRSRKPGKHHRLPWAIRHIRAIIS